jgi:hypothetical protein
MDALPPANLDQGNETPPRNPWRTAWLLLAFGMGLGAFLLTGALSAIGLLLALIDRQRFSASSLLPILSLAAAGAGFGLPLVWQAIAGLRGKPSRRFTLPLVWGIALILIYLLALVGGQTVLSLRLAPTLTLPPLHVLAFALPPLLCLWGAAALAKDPQFTWRQLWGGLGGAFGSLTLAFLAELILLVMGGAVVAVMMATTPNWAELLRRLRPTPDGLTTDPALIRSLLRNPLVIVALLVSLSLVVPLIEEAVKSLVPALAGAWQKPSVTRLFLLGVAGGAGFAVIEGILNGGLSGEEWASVALLRVGSSAMHCFTAGLTGWGWGQVWTRRKWLYLVLTYGLAVLIHGTWNAVSIGMGVVAEAMDPGVLQTTLVGASVGMLIFLMIGLITALMIMAKRCSIPQQPPTLVDGGVT